MRTSLCIIRSNGETETISFDGTASYSFLNIIGVYFVVAFVVVAVVVVAVVVVTVVAVPLIVIVGDLHF